MLWLRAASQLEPILRALHNYPLMLGEWYWVVRRMDRFFILLLVVAGMLASHLRGQSTSPLPIRWQKNYGGYVSDVAKTVVRTPDGGYLLGGWSRSPAGGNKQSGNFGGTDFWVVRTDSNGNKLWDRNYGGTESDQLTAALALSDGGFLLGGSSSTTSTNGNKTGTGWGGADFWIIRTDALGNPLWDRLFGGRYDDNLAALVAVANGGFLLAGHSVSPLSGNKGSTNYGFYDLWAVRINAAGQLLWERSFGGTSGDLMMGANARATPDGGFVLGGHSMSPPSGSKTSPVYGDLDFWLVRLDANGNQLWDRSYGGSGLEALTALQVTADNGFILAGNTKSPISGNKTTPTYGFYDLWVVRLNASGDKLWDQTVGGNDYDYCMAVQQSFDGGFLVGAQTYSLGGGTKTATNILRAPGVPSNDYWLVQLDSAGRQLWDRTIGGSDEDELAAIQADEGSGFVLLGSSISSGSGVKTLPNYGELDYWVVKVGGLDSYLRLQPLTAASFRFPAEPQYLYISERSSDLAHWSPFQTNFFTHSPITVLDPSGAAGQFYRVRLGSARHAPADLWRPLFVTGRARSSRVYLFLTFAGQAYIDDVQLVAGEVPESGVNAIRGGDFESDLSSWTVPPNYGASHISTDVYRSGRSSLKLVSDGTTATPVTVFQQEALPIATNTTYTLSLWYLPTTNYAPLTLRLSDNSVSITTNLLHQPGP